MSDSVISEPTNDEMEDFRNKILEWTKIDDKMKRLAIALRECRVQHKALGGQIQEFMIKNEYNKVNTNSGRISSIVKNVPKALKLNEVREKILEYQGLTGEELIEKIFDDANRPVYERRSIRRTIPSVSISLTL